MDKQKTSKLEVDPLGEEGKEEKIGRKEGRKEGNKDKNSNKAKKSRSEINILKCRARVRS